MLNQDEITTKINFYSLMKRNKQNIQQFLKFFQITKRKRRDIEFIKTTTTFMFFQIIIDQRLII